jgi:GNAT superfamily N-acetyltransferase
MVAPEVIRVESVDRELTYPLRHRVLRSHQPIESLQWDDTDETVAFAALTEDAQVVGTAVVQPAPCPWRPDDPGAWRLRGMATVSELRGHGIGERVLRAAVEHIEAAGGRLVWCNARTPAISFYERAGFAVEGDRWDDAKIGPHVPMCRVLSGRQRA